MAYNNSGHMNRAVWKDKFIDNTYMVFGTDEDIGIYFDGYALQLDYDNCVAADDSGGGKGKALAINTTPTLTTAGQRQGACLALDMDRTSGYALTTWDGNPDCAMKITATSRGANTSSVGAVRALDILARQRDSGATLTWINGALITAENRTGAGSITNLIGLEVHAKNNAVATGDVMCLRVYDESQSGTGTNYAISISCTNDSAFTREFCVHINSGASSAWTNGLTFDGNVTNAFDFADTDGTNGATRSTDYATTGNLDGKIRVDVGGNTLYIPLYDSIT